MKTFKEPTIGITVRVSVDVYLTLREQSGETRKSINEFVNDILKEYFAAAGIETFNYKEYLKAQIKAELKKEMELTLF